MNVGLSWTWEKIKDKEIFLIPPRGSQYYIVNFKFNIENVNKRFFKKEYAFVPKIYNEIW